MAFINMRGVTFSVFQPNITIKFHSNNVIVTKMYVQVNFSKYPSNIRQICVTLYNNNLTRLTYRNGTIIPLLRSPMNRPVIEGWFQNVKSIHVRLCNTSNGLPPQRFRFAVIGCYTSLATYIVPGFSQSVTTAPCKFYCIEN